MSSYHYSTVLFRRPLPDTFTEDQKVMEKVYERLKPEAGRIDLSDLFFRWGRDRKAIVDDVHYSPGFNELVAQQIASHIDFRSLATQIRSFDESAATGQPRGSFVH